MEVKDYKANNSNSLDEIIKREFGNTVVKIQDKDAINRHFIYNNKEKVGEIIQYTNGCRVIKY